MPKHKIETFEFPYTFHLSSRSLGTSIVSVALSLDISREIPGGRYPLPLTLALAKGCPDFPHPDRSGRDCLICLDKYLIWADLGAFQTA